MSDIDLKLSAQRVLWGKVTKYLRSASIEANNNKILWKAIFDIGVSKDDLELLNIAGSEIIADFHDNFTIEEIIETTPYPNNMKHLHNLVYLRHEE